MKFSFYSLLAILGLSLIFLVISDDVRADPDPCNENSLNGAEVSWCNSGCANDPTHRNCINKLEDFDACGVSAPSSEDCGFITGVGDTNAGGGGEGSGTGGSCDKSGAECIAPENCCSGSCINLTFPCDPCSICI